MENKLLSRDEVLKVMKGETYLRSQAVRVSSLKVYSQNNFIDCRPRAFLCSIFVLSAIMSIALWYTLIFQDIFSEWLVLAAVVSSSGSIFTASHILKKYLSSREKLKKQILSSFNELISLRRYLNSQLKYFERHINLQYAYADKNIFTNQNYLYNIQNCLTKKINKINELLASYSGKNILKIDRVLKSTIKVVNPIDLKQEEIEIESKNISKCIDVLVLNQHLYLKKLNNDSKDSLSFISSFFKQAENY